MAPDTIRPGRTIDLPEPPKTDGSSVSAAIARRRSVRSFEQRSLDLETVAHLLWATAGVTDAESGFRAAPSAGATYPLVVDLTVTTWSVDQLAAGVYRYRPATHTLDVRSLADVHGPLRAAALDQAWVERAPITVVISGVDARTTTRYGQRGRERYVPMEAGHAGQNLALQATALDLGTVPVGAFEDEAVASVLDLAAEERPLYVFPVGYPA